MVTRYPSLEIIQAMSDAALGEKCKESEKVEPKLSPKVAREIANRLLSSSAWGPPNC